MMRFRLLAAALPLLLASCQGHPSIPAEVQSALTELDRTLQAENFIIRTKESRITDLRDHLRQEEDPYARYQILHSLYEEYARYRLDSALAYAHRKEALAREIGSRVLLDDARLNLAERYLISGQYRYAQLALDAIAPGPTTPASRLCAYYRAYTSLYHGMKITSKDPLLTGRLDSLEHVYRNRFRSQADSTMLAFHTYRADDAMEAGDPALARGYLEEVLRGRKNSADDLAILHYSLAKTYRMEGNTDLALAHYAMSAHEDLSHGVKASRSLIQTARFAMEKGLTDKAFTYVTRAYEDATQSDARVCLNEISAFMPAVISSYGKLNERRFQDIRLIMVLLENGKVVEYPDDGTRSYRKFYARRHPRTLIGYTPDGWLYFIVVDGRFPGQADGMTIAELQSLCVGLGLEEALNLDGGGSSTLWTSTEGVINHPYDNRAFDHAGERRVPNILIVK